MQEILWPDYNNLFVRRVDIQTIIFPLRPSEPQNRETREGMAQPTVETEANGYSWSTYERGPHLQLVRWAVCRYNRYGTATKRNITKRKSFYT